MSKHQHKFSPQFRADAMDNGSREVWVTVTSVYLPLPKRLSGPPCMAARTGILSVRPGSECCWFHRGDWAVANEMAVEALTELERSGRSADGLRDELLRILGRRSPNEWVEWAAASLVDYPINLDSDFVDLANGRHRVQAMMDQGIEYIVAQWHRYDESEPAGVRVFEL